MTLRSNGDDMKKSLPARLRRLTHLLLFTCTISLFAPGTYALPSYARQTGQRCAACHVGGNWPQLTPWGRFFKLAGYTAGKTFIDREGFQYVPVGALAKAGITFAGQPNNSQGQTVIAHNGEPELYNVTPEFGTRLTDWAGVFYEYSVQNTFPGWKGSANVVDIRATHFFYPGNHELLVGFDTNNTPTVQDVWNTTPAFSYPFYSSPQAPGAPASPMIANLGTNSGGVGLYALFDRQFYAEVSMYRVGNDFFRFMNPAVSFKKALYLDGWNPYWRAYWTKDKGSNVWMLGTFGMQSKVYPNSASPSGPSDSFDDTGVDSQYQYLRDNHKITVRAAYIYEAQAWHGSYPVGKVSVPKGNLKSFNLSGSYALRNTWTFTAGYSLTNGSNNAALYGITDANGNLISKKPNTTGYQLEIDRTLTQNIIAMVKYSGFTKFNGRTGNIDGLGRTPSNNNTLWINLYFAF